MMRVVRYAVCLGLLASLGAGPAQGAEQPPRSFDVVIYGGTSGGVAAAVQVVRMGKTALLIEPGEHLGGLTSGGLGATDIGNKAAIGGISREFYREMGAHYADDAHWNWQRRDQYKSRRQANSKEPEMWTFEPHVAEEIYDRWAQTNPRITLVRNGQLDLKNGVRKDGNRIEAIVLEDGRVFTGKMFLDATYEGDLMAKAGVSYHVGRESNDTYGETLNGVQTRHATKHQFERAVDPYVVPGDPESGLLPGVEAGPPEPDGTGDHRVQAYNFRMCLTDHPENRIPFPKPEGYDPQRYELLRRYLDAGVWDAFRSNSLMPNRKTDTNNNGAFSTDNIGMNYDYPDGDYETREKIFQEHVRYQQGLMYFLANDPRVPEHVREQVSRWGLCKDEFVGTGGWPHQMYVREARRMISDYVMTQHDCQGRVVADDPVGLGAYNMDSHNTQRYVDADGHARNEGDVQVGVSPYPVSYRSIVPKESECANLAVPVCLSASHIAFGSIRMEPVFMVLGQSAATAAVQAIEAGCSLQGLPYGPLRERLLEDGQVLEWTGPRRTPAVLVAKLEGIALDDLAGERVGNWATSASVTPFVEQGYLHDDNGFKGEKSVSFQLPIEKPGRYEVRLGYSPNPNRATNVPVRLMTKAGAKDFVVNQKKVPPIQKVFLPLGTFELTPGEAVLTISNADTDGYVTVDAVQVLPAK